MGDLTTRSYTGSPGPGGSPKDSDNGSHPSGAMGPSEGNWATDMAIFNNAVEELDHEFLADASPSKLRRGDTTRSLGGYQYEEMDDELSASLGTTMLHCQHGALPSQGFHRLPSLTPRRVSPGAWAQQSSGGPGGTQKRPDDILSPRQQYLHHVSIVAWPRFRVCHAGAFRRRLTLRTLASGMPWAVPLRVPGQASHHRVAQPVRQLADG